jgi:hypothetical protein
MSRIDEIRELSYQKAQELRALSRELRELLAENERGLPPVAIHLADTPAHGSHKAYTLAAALSGYIAAQKTFPVKMPPIYRRDGTLITSVQIRSTLHRMHTGGVVLLKDGNVFRLYKPD